MERAVKYCVTCYHAYDPDADEHSCCRGSLLNGGYVSRQHSKDTGDGEHSEHSEHADDTPTVIRHHQHVMRFDTHACAACGKKCTSSTFDAFMLSIDWQIAREAREGVCSRYMMDTFGNKCIKALSDRRRAALRELGFLPRVVANIVGDYLVHL
jgi:hypothetical protein